MPFGLKPKKSRRLFMDLQEVCKGSKLFGKAWKGCMRGVAGFTQNLVLPEPYYSRSPKPQGKSESEC